MSDPALLVERCDACSAVNCPPRGVCRACGCRRLTPTELRESLRVWSWTVNHQRWLARLDVPTTVVVAEDPDRPGVRLLGELRDAREVHTGMAVRPLLERDASGEPRLTFRAN